MNKRKFNNLVKGSTEAAKSDLNLLDDLQKNHPYSQVIHALTAKSHKNLDSEVVSQKISFAAIYSTDRKVLKSFIEGVPIPTPPAKPKIKEVAKSEKIAPKKEEEDRKSVDIKEDIGDVKKDKTDDSSAPKETSKSLQSTDAKVATESKDSTPSDPPVKIDGEMDLIRKEIMDSLESLTKSKKLFKEKKAESEKKTNAKPEIKTTAKSEVKRTKGVKKKIAIRNKPENKLVEEINTREAKPIGKKQEKQNKLIEEFIVRQPSIQKPDAEPDSMDKETQDLARQSVSFGDDLVSENLAIIFTEQGKKDKAIDIYKKLIWKYPKKKTYFAGQIKKLQKK